MKTYGQFCPLAQAAQLLCERWTLIVVRELIAGSTRFTELKKGVPTMSPTLLSTRLKQLLEAGVIERNGSNGNFTYTLTQAGKELQPIVELMGAWGHRWARSNLNKNDLDAGLLMWDMRRSVNSLAFPKRKVVVQFEYPDAPRGAKNWWIISEAGETDLCLNDPGFDVDIVVQCSLRTMTEIWICERTFNEAVRAGDIKVLGDVKLKSKLQSWLCTSPLAKLGTEKKLSGLAWQ